MPQHSITELTEKKTKIKKKRQLPDGRHIHLSAFDHFAQPCILWLLEKEGINATFLPLKDQKCISSHVSTNETTGEKQGAGLG